MLRGKDIAKPDTSPYIRAHSRIRRIRCIRHVPNMHHIRHLR